jgi:hypothetical protein
MIDYDDDFEDEIEEEIPKPWECECPRVADPFCTGDWPHIEVDCQPECRYCNYVNR